MMKNHPNNNHQMNKKYIKTHFLPYNLHLIQLGNRNNVKNILSNWIHTLIDEASIESTPPSEHHTTFSKNKHSYKFWFHHVKTSSYPSFWYWKSRTPIQTDWTSYSTQKFPTWLLQLSVWYFSLIEDLLPFKPFVLVSLHFLSSWIIYKKKETTTF